MESDNGGRQDVHGKDNGGRQTVHGKDNGGRQDGAGKDNGGRQDVLVRTTVAVKTVRKGQRWPSRRCCAVGQRWPQDVQVSDNGGRQDGAAGGHCTAKDLASFLSEATLMKDFNHPNVLSLLGLVITYNKPHVVLPFMQHGDLKSYIKAPSRSITVRELLAFGVQIANGMCYLAMQKFVHRDLATRNCMVDEELTVKIADFGLSRDVYRTDYYRVEDKHRPLPVRWMAIESLTLGVFTSKSDVWSFGVTLWELLTRGCSPYPDVDSFNIKSYVMSGRRMSQPQHAPDDVYALISRCWQDDPDHRPSFKNLHVELRDIIDRSTANNHHEYLQLVDL
ncbi:hypothetical protein NP493_342g02055 [Ridgeia piscesae]|uniref:receptor protein-tyrosine kinase n=1 Tax=Ridgeia piscesae TaxID=27915 RepID=A0AAD9L4C2_RIDPI|nr:hypothetical protein NP493_342g02055 [Ridgeia piscesae]